MHLRLSKELNSQTASMIEIHIESDEEACRELWEQLIPPGQLTDLWDVRACFHKQFKRRLFFVVAQEAEEIVGFIPMSFVEEQNYYGYFPGEVWEGKTWLEQNRVIARDQDVLQQMFDWLLENKVPYHLRYLHKNPQCPLNLFDEDEIGYLFHPESFHFRMEEYYSVFSKKTLKKIRREVDKLYKQNLIFRCGENNDFEEMVILNIERFGTRSYFANNQFVKSFRSLRDYLAQKGWLKMTTIMIDGRIAAVDMGCQYNGAYTLLSGATHSDYPGIAKVINLFHMEEACKKKYKEADFLCGDFFWKKLFHLTPRPLYKISNKI